MGYEVDFPPVGNNNRDAICVRYGIAEPGYKIHVVDSSYADTGQVIVDHIKKYYGKPTYIDHVVRPHADHDHAWGLKAVLKAFDVGALWTNRPWLYYAEIIDNFHGGYPVVSTREYAESTPGLFAYEYEE